MRRKERPDWAERPLPEPLRASTFHSPDGSELHFRYVGCHGGRHFVVNVKIPAIQDDTGARLSCDEYGSAVADVLKAVIEQAFGKLTRSR